MGAPALAQSTAGWHHSKASVQPTVLHPWMMVVLPLQFLPVPGTQCWSSNEAGLCLRAAFSLKSRAHMGQAHQEPLANIFVSRTAWVQGWVLQRGGKEPFLDGNMVGLVGLSLIHI